MPRSTFRVDSFQCPCASAPHDGAQKHLVSFYVAFTLSVSCSNWRDVIVIRVYNEELSAEEY
jgi:hypothetical protein